LRASLAIAKPGGRSISSNDVDHVIHLSRITIREIGLRLKEPFRISSGVTQERRVLLVQIEDREGAIGWGECPAGEFPHYSPETVDTAWVAICQWIAPLVLGDSFDQPADLADLLAKNIRGHRMAKAGVEMATHEMLARKRGCSLSELLGGTRESIETGISIGIQVSPERLAEKAVAAAEAGYKRIKVKIQPLADEKYVAMVHEAVGDRLPIMADANSAYSLDDLEVLKRLDAFNLLMIEQPLPWDDLVRHAELQRHLTTPLCLDESIVSLDRAEDMMSLKSGRIINIKPARVGGFTEAIRIHDLAVRHDVPVWCGGLLESGVGRAHNVALASLPNFKLPGDLSPSNRYWDRDIVVPEWTMDNGKITVPRKAPGMGVQVDMDYVESLTVRMETMSG